MYIVVVGGGTVGYGLTIELLRNSEHEVVLIDNDSAVVRDLRDELGDSVVQGDGTEVVFLESIGLARADLIIAVTGSDSHNLVSAQVAKHWFHVPRAIARVNDPLNERLFRLLGVDSTVSAASAVLAQLEVDLPEHTLVPLMHLRRRGLEVVDLHVQPGSPAAGRAIRELTLPPQALISLVVGLDGTPQVPTGDTVLQVGDELIAVIAEDSESALRHLVAAPVVLEPDPVRGD